MTEIPELGTTKFTDLLLGFTTAEDLETLIITVLSHPGGTAKAVYGEATHSQVPRDGRRPPVHVLSRSRHTLGPTHQRRFLAPGSCALALTDLGSRTRDLARCLVNVWRLGTQKSAPGDLESALLPNHRGFKSTQVIHSSTLTFEAGQNPLTRVPGPLRG